MLQSRPLFRRHRPILPSAPDQTLVILGDVSSRLAKRCAQFRRLTQALQRELFSYDLRTDRPQSVFGCILCLCAKPLALSNGLSSTYFAKDCRYQRTEGRAAGANRCMATSVHERHFFVGSLSIGGNDADLVDLDFEFVWRDLSAPMFKHDQGSSSSTRVALRIRLRGSRGSRGAQKCRRRARSRG